MIAVFSQDVREVDTLLNKVEIISQEKIGATRFYTAIINKEAFLIVVSGYAKINLGAAVSLALQRYQIEKIIGVGDCGCLKSRGAKLGNIAVSEVALQYDVDYSPLGYKPSLVIGLSQSKYPSDEKLVELAIKEAKLLNIPCISEGFGSADRFLADGDMMYSISQEFGITCVDGESGSIGEFAFINNIPYVYVKGISNYADECAPCQYRANRGMADSTACNVVYHMLDSLTRHTICDCRGYDDISSEVDVNHFELLSRKDMMEYLAEIPYTHLSLCNDGKPYTVPMCFSVKQRGNMLLFCLYSNPDSGKMEMLAQNNKVCLSFDKDDCDSMISIIVEGTAEVISGYFTAACNNDMYAIKVTANCMRGRRYFYCLDK